MGRVTGECREWVWSVELYIGLMVNFPGHWRMKGMASVLGTEHRG